MFWIVRLLIVQHSSPECDIDLHIKQERRFLHLPSARLLVKTVQANCTRGAR